MLSLELLYVIIPFVQREVGDGVAIGSLGGYLMNRDNHVKDLHHVVTVPLYVIIPFVQREVGMDW